MPAARAQGIPESAYELGSLVQDFPVSRAELLMNLLCVPLLLGVGAAMVYVRVPNLLAPQSVIEFLALAGGSLFTLGAIVWGVLIISKAYRNREMRVLVFEKGFVSFRPDRVFTCRWDEIEWTTEGLFQRPMAAVHQLTVHLHSGDEWKLSKDTDIVKDFPRLIETIERNVAQRLLPQALADLRAGKSLDFGRLKLTAEGIQQDDRVLPWTEFKAIHGEEFRVTVEQKGAWLTWAAVASGALTNKRLLLELATQLVNAASWDVVHA